MKIMKTAKTKRVALPPMFLMAFLCFTTSCLAQTRDFWLKTQRKGTDFISDHRIVRPLEKDGFEYRSDTHMKIDLLGIKQDLIQKGTYIVDANLYPVSFEVYNKSRAKDVHVTGEYGDGLMHLTIRHEDGDVLTRVVPFQNTYFAVVLGDLILKREKDKTFNINLFDTKDMIVVNTQVEVTESNEKAVEATITHYLTEKFSINRRGYINRIEFIETHMRCYLTDAENAQNITYLNTADGYILMVKSKKSFPNVHKVAKAQIQVRWKDIPFEEFNLEDNRQKVVKKTLTKDEYEVILEFIKANLASKGVEAPIDDERLAPFLKDTDFIKPSDPAIQQQMVEIRSDEKDAYAIIQKILKWISSNIKQDIIVETLTGPEVLKKKRGKCAEYTILFASLARAAGIPTKVVLVVESSGGNTWIGHVWNEVWLGNWMSVDAMQGSFATGPSLIKFMDGSSVMGIESIRHKLVDNFGLEILDFTEEQTITIAEVTTGITDNTYSNRDFACRISAPKIGWSISETTISGIPIITIQPNEEKAITFRFTLLPVPPGTSPKTILDARTNVIAGMAKNFKKLEEGEIKIAGQTVPRVVYQFNRETGSSSVFEDCFLVDGVNGYLFSYETPKDRFKEHRESVIKIYESFELVK
ncbi:MAG TPA: transglutaminase-like domain-containing protein [Desulfosporosinus sp.]|nr:transglutaminase-like domain-containing protein [Desulfosporosinus sp.]